MATYNTYLQSQKCPRLRMGNTQQVDGKCVVLNMARKPTHNIKFTPRYRNLPVWRSRKQTRTSLRDWILNDMEGSEGDCVNLRRLRPELWRQKNWLLHHDNALSQTSLLTWGFFWGPKTTWLSSQPTLLACFGPERPTLREHDFQDAF
jgi:hypothetical protein